MTRFSLLAATFATAILITGFASVGGFASAQTNSHFTPERLAEVNLMLEAVR